MSIKLSRYTLRIYDLLLSIGAIYNGTLMVIGKFWSGEWPEVWIGKVPFTSWFWPGVIAIILYGVGNLIAAYFTFSNTKKSWQASGIIGLIFLGSLIVSIYILGETYLATGMFIILSVIQLILSLIVGLIDVINYNHKKVR